MGSVWPAVAAAVVLASRQSDPPDIVEPSRLKASGDNLHGMLPDQHAKIEAIEETIAAICEPSGMQQDQASHRRLLAAILRQVIAII